MTSPPQLNVYRSCRPVVDAEYGDQTDSSPVAAVVDAIATAADVDPLELPPLFDVVDTDALADLFDHPEDTQTVLAFRIERWNVFVRGDGSIRICDGSQPTAPEPVFESPVA